MVSKTDATVRSLICKLFLELDFENEGTLQENFCFFKSLILFCCSLSKIPQGIDNCIHHKGSRTGSDLKKVTSVVMQVYCDKS